MTCRLTALVALGIVPVAGPAQAAWRQAPLPATRAAVTAMSLAPSQPASVYVGLRGLGVFSTTDRGITWTDRSQDLPRDVVITDIAVHPADPATVYASSEARGAAAGAVWRTTDSGAHWTASAPVADGSVLAVAIHPLSPATVYAGTGGGALPGVYRSTDAGSTWTYLSGALPGESIHALALSPADPSILLAGTSGGRARTTDGGVTWTSVPPGGPGFRSFSWSSADPNVVYGCPGSDAGLLAYPSRSTDQGVTFSSLSSLGYLASATSIAVHPDDADQVFASGVDQIYYPIVKGTVWSSTNGGANWSVQLTVNGFPDDTKILFDPVNPNHLYAASEHPGPEGFRHSSDSGATWTLRIGGLKNYPIDRIAGDGAGTIYVLTHNHLYVSLGDPSLWLDRGYAQAGWEVGRSSYGIVASPYPGTAYRWGYWTEGDVSGTYFAPSHDYGVSWYLGYNGVWYLPPGMSGPIRDVAVGANGYQVYVSDEWKGLVRNDGGGGLPGLGDVYAVIDPALGDVQIATDPQMPLKVYFAGGPLTMSVSTDAGATRSPLNVGLPGVSSGDEIADLFVDPFDGSGMVVVYADGRVYESVNAGASWSLRTDFALVPGDIRDVSWDPVSRHVFLATESRGLVSEYPGLPREAPSEDVRSVYYSLPGRRLYCGTENAGLWSTPLLLYDTRNADGVLPPARKEVAGGSVRVHPNPSGGDLAVTLSIAESGPVEITVFDSGGRRVRGLSPGKHSSGELSLRWDGRDDRGRSVPAGVYFVLATAGQESHTAKVIIRR